MVYLSNQSGLQDRSNCYAVTAIEKEIGKMKKRDTVAVMIRMPPAMKTWLQQKTERSTASLSAEAVRALRDVMDRELEASRQHRRKAAAS